MRQRWVKGDGVDFCNVPGTALGKGWGRGVGVMNLLGGLLSAYNLQQGHDVGRAEEVRPNDAILRLGLLPNQVNVNGGGVAGQDAVRPTHPLQICNTSLPGCNIPSFTPVD